MATGGIDIVTFFLSQSDSDTVLLQKIVETKRILIVGSDIVLFLDFVVWDQIDIGVEPFQKIADLPGFFQRVIDAFQQEVFKGQSPIVQ